jgi:predicted ribosome quality control (RQC) complex YloA/Tae2 family protein
LDRIKETLEKAKEASAQEGTAPKKSKKKNVDVLRKALSQGFPEYPPLLLDHAFAVKEVDPATPLEKVLGDDALIEQVSGVLKEAQSVTIKLSAKEDHPGYIVAKEDKRPTAESTAGTGEPSHKAGLLYEDFHPFRPRQFERKPEVKVLEFSTFNATVDEYFSSLETQKLESRLTEREEAAKRKLDAVRQEHEKRLGALKVAQEIHVRKAAAIEDNVYRVQEAMDAVNGLIAQGMDWVEIARLIEMEQGRGNPVAQIIKLPLKLYENTITLVLGEASEEQDAADDLFSDESEEESESEEQEAARKAPEMLTIDIDLGLSPWANATQYYEQKKMAAVKEQKTAQSSTKALKSHEKKVTEDLKRNLKQEKQVLRPARKPFWFEKFLFFISSEGYLVLGGRDAMQSELLYRRHLKKGDIFVHADLEGARPMIVKNRPGTPDAPIPPSTLSQAGNLCVATSSAWESKAVMAAWWVNANQVTKTTTGGLLPTGEFEVKGEKNFLAPSQLVLGFAVMFQISKESLKNHKIHIFEDATPTEPSAKEGEITKQPAENEPPAAQESGPAEADKLAANGSSEQGNEPSSESDDEDMNPDSIPPRNPLQRGVSEPIPEQEGTSGEPKGDEEDDESEGQGEAAQSFQEERAAEEAESPEEKAATSRDTSEPSQLSKGGSLEPTADSKEANRASKQTANGLPVPEKPASSKKAAPAPAKGKKGKGKKGADKYAHQDEEERELALRLVGAKSAKAEKAAAAAAAKAQREREAEAQKQRRKAQHERAAEAERRRQALFDEGAADDYNEEIAAAEAADLSWIPALIGTPRPEDDILAAIPICAPWAALGRYKYRVKLQPGTVKKGKAVKEILGRWVAETTTGKVRKEQAEEAGISIADAEKLRAREGELFKAWKDTEIINTVPVPKVRIMTGGGATGGDAKGKGKGGSGGNKGGKGGKKK